MTTFLIPYRGYAISPGDYGGFQFIHPDYDGAPEDYDGPPADPRYGNEATIQACRETIDWIEDEVIPERIARRQAR